MKERTPELLDAERSRLRREAAQRGRSGPVQPREARAVSGLREWARCHLVATETLPTRVSAEPDGTGQGP
jgi:hypothetical protein